MGFKQTDCGILYLNDYYPARFAEHSGISEKILKFKDNDDYAVASLCDEIKKALADYQNKSRQSFSDAYVCIVPSHEKDKYSDGLKFLADSISREFSCNVSGKQNASMNSLPKSLVFSWRNY